MAENTPQKRPDHERFLDGLQAIIEDRTEALCTIIAHAGSAIECVGEPAAGYLREVCEIAEGVLPPKAEEGATAPRSVEIILKLIEGDPHQWSKRPCQTCRAISDVAGRSFGCIRKAEQAHPADTSSASTSGEVDNEGCVGRGGM